MNIRSARELGALIRSRRQRCGWTQAKLAEKAGVSALWISQLERGKSSAQFGLILRTLQNLGLTLLIEEPGERGSHPVGGETSSINLDDIVGGEN
ncbi:MAG: helix-turn-helix transcriptional regulator [Verrucomicrobiaceae bacterium]|nr:helix-turn-helix transcriptional regulator [Verrucomicrobiaceae bacterium]